MKFSCTSFGLAVVAAVVLAFSPSALAGQGKNATTLKRTVTIQNVATLGGSTLAQGQYDAEVELSEPTVLVLKRDRKEVARVRVTRKDLVASAKYDRVDVRTANDGSKEVVAIVFKGSIESFLVADNAGVALVDKP